MPNTRHFTPPACPQFTSPRGDYDHNHDQDATAAAAADAAARGAAAAADATDAAVQEATLGGVEFAGW